VKESKTMLYGACERLGLRYWKSDANFVLVRTGEHTEAVLSAALARGVYLRDRSREPGCEGCIRITTGIVEHTRQALAVMDEVLCAAR
jgi:histidinol-phosphate aminotransferase